MKATSLIIKVMKGGKPSLIDYKSTTDKKLKKETTAIIKSLNKNNKKVKDIYGDL